MAQGTEAASAQPGPVLSTLCAGDTHPHGVDGGRTPTGDRKGISTCCSAWDHQPLGRHVHKALVRGGASGCSKGNGHSKWSLSCRRDRSRCLITTAGPGRLLRLSAGVTLVTAVRERCCGDPRAHILTP